MNDITYKKLSDFLIAESSSLEKIDLEIKKFNPFAVLNIEEFEIRHSNFLAWILDPNGSHNSYDYTLRRLIGELENVPDEKKIKYQLADLRETEIYREQNHIDILIINHIHKFVICIENKINANRSGENQLIKYAEIIDSEWKEKEYDTFFVFLTKTHSRLTDDEINIGFENITYGTIIQILEKLLNEVSLEPKVSDFIDFYVQNFKKNMMSNEHELTKLAIEIYRKHKIAIDYIVSKKPVIFSPENFNYAYEKIKNNKKFIFLSPNEKGLIRFLPKEVEKYFTNQEFHSWRDTNIVFAIELFLMNESLEVKFCLGGINNNKKFDELQLLKTEIFNKLVKLKSYGQKINSRAKATSKYPGIIWKVILRTSDDIFLESNSFGEAFEKSFCKFEEDILNKWVEEVKANF